MLTHAACDEVSSLAAPDLAQRLAEHSSRRKMAHASVTQHTSVREALPGCVQVLLWDTKLAGGVAPRCALLRNDLVKETTYDGGALSSLSLSSEVRFHVARRRRRQLLAVLSFRSVAPAPRLSGVDTTHFYWMDECSPAVCVCHEGQQQQRLLILQKRVLRWALYAFNRNPLLKNIPLPSVEAAFPALLAYTPREREELVKQAAEILGRGTVVWYSGTLIRHFSDAASLLVFPLLSPQEERCAAAMLFALANTHQIAVKRLSEVSRAARLLLETYGTQHVALSLTLTQSLLLVASALTVQRRGSMPSGRTMLDLSHGLLALLARADAASLTSLVALTDATPPPPVREVLARMRAVAREAMYNRGRSYSQSVGAVRTRQREAEEEDVTDFFSDTSALKVNAGTLSSCLVAEVDTLLPASAAASGDVAVRARLLEWVPKWWERDATSLHAAAAATGETELRINAKTAATALREPRVGDDALLAVIQDTRKRRRGAGAQLTSHAVQAALDEADVRLRRRTFLLLVDTLALNGDRESRTEAATRFLQRHNVDSLRISRFTASLTAAPNH